MVFNKKMLALNLIFECVKNANVVCFFSKTLVQNILLKMEGKLGPKASGKVWNQLGPRKRNS